MLIKFEPSIEDLGRVIDQYQPGALKLVYLNQDEFYIVFTDEWLAKNDPDNRGGALLYYTYLSIKNPPVYECDLNTDHLITDYYRVHHPNVSVDKYFGNGYMYDYGVADSPEQLLEDYTVQMDFVNSKERYICLCTWIRKEDQPSEGGWRWHKWGEYIGKQKRQRDYLYDEPNIDAVIVFHFLRISEGEQI